MKIIGRIVPKFDIAVSSAEGVAERWKSQYFTDGQWRYRGEQVYAAVVDAGEDLDAVVAAIGNKSWTHPSCSCCNEYVDRAVVLLDDRSTVVCKPCLVAMAKGVDE